MRSRRLPNARVNRFCRFHSWMVSQGLACVAGAKRGGGRRRGEGENPLSPIPLSFSFPSLLLSTPVRSSKKYDTHIEWSIWFQAFLSPQRTNVTHGQIISWNIYLNGQRFWACITIKFNASAGEEHFALMACGTLVALDAKLVCFAAVFPPLFSPEASKVEWAHFCWMHREKKLSSWRRIWSISSILHLFANQQIEQSNTYKCSSLKRCGSRPWWILPQANKDI